MRRLRWWWSEKRERLDRWAANVLPRRIAYFAAIRVGAHATCGQWGNQVVPDLRFMDALQRWEIHHDH
jgi:hypothetical protein